MRENLPQVLIFQRTLVVLRDTIGTPADSHMIAGRIESSNASLQDQALQARIARLALRAL